MTPIQRLLSTAALSLTVTTAVGCASQPQAAAQPQASSFPNYIEVRNVEQNVITVQSAETVKVVPDMAQISFSVATQEKDAKTCQEKNNEDLTRVIQFLKDFGISAESIQTSNYGMNPIYDWSAGQKITGYEMESALTVSDITIEQTGTLLTACVDAGINNINRVSYFSSQYDTCYQEALTKAIASAREKAQAIAEAGGCALGAVVHVEEYTDSQELRYNSYSKYSRDSGGVAEAAMADMAVEPGQVSIEARVCVDFSIN
jgi:uncharacterized protein YggE